MSAIEGGNVEIVKSILAYKFKCDKPKWEKDKLKPDEFGNNPLHIAFKNYNVEIS